MSDLLNSDELRAAEIKRLISDFEEKFKAGTSDPDHFMSMSDIEMLWSNLRKSTDKIYSDMVVELLSHVDESQIISKKNGSSSKKESD